MQSERHCWLTLFKNVQLTHVCVKNRRSSVRLSRRFFHDPEGHHGLRRICMVKSEIRVCDILHEGAICGTTAPDHERKATVRASSWEERVVHVSCCWLVQDRNIGPFGTTLSTGLFMNLPQFCCTLP